MKPHFYFKATTATTWENVVAKISEDSIKLDGLEKLMDDISTSSELSSEFKSLVSAIATNTCRILKAEKETKQCQALFASKDKSDKTKSVANFVTKVWLKESIISLQSSSSESSIDEKTNMHIQILLSSIEFIQSAFVIDNVKKLTVLKEKRDLDWQGLVDEIGRLSTEKNLPQLQKAVLATKAHIDNIVNPPPPATNEMKTEAAPAIPALRKVSLEEIQAKKRAERIAQMKSSARATSVRQAVPKKAAAAAAATMSVPAATPVDVSKLFTFGEKEPPPGCWKEVKSDFPWSSVTWAAMEAERSRNASQDSQGPRLPGYDQDGFYSGTAPIGGGSGDGDMPPRRTSSNDVVGAHGSAALEKSSASQSNVVGTSHDNQPGGGAIGSYSGGHDPPGVGVSGMDQKVDHNTFQRSQKRPNQQSGNRDGDWNNNNKRPRNAGPSHSQGSGPPPPSGGAGRGRGRGANLNLPAWMTNGNTNGPQGAGTSAAPPPLNPHRPMGGDGREQGRGRGTHMNKPAWMTHGGAGNGPQQGAPPGAPFGSGPPPPGRGPPPPRQGRFPDSGPPGGGRGRGRGRDMNLPAWMTQQNNDNSV